MDVLAASNIFLPNIYYTVYIHIVEGGFDKVPFSAGLYELKSLHSPEFRSISLIHGSFFVDHVLRQVYNLKNIIINI